MRGAGGGPGALEEGRVTIAIEGLGLSDPGPGPAPRPHRRFTLKRILIAAGALLGTLLLLTGSFIGISLYRIDHAVHHVGVSASLLAQGKNDLLAIVKGPDHTEQVFVFHDTGARTNILQIPQALGLPMKNGSTVPLEKSQPARTVRHHRRPRPSGHPRDPLRRRRPAHGEPALEPRQAGQRDDGPGLPDVEPGRRQLAAHAGGLAHLARDRAHRCPPSCPS